VAERAFQRPASLAALPPGYHALFDRAAQVLWADTRVRALWVSGSLARADADAFSDLDLVVAVEDAGFDEFAADWRSWLAAITPTVIAREIPFLRGSVYSLTPTCERLDVVVERASAVKNAFLPRAVVFDRDDLDAQRPRPLPPAGPDPQKVAFAIEEPFRYLAMFPVLLGRNDFLLGQEAWGHLRRRLSEVFLAANAPLPATGVKHWRDKLTPAQYAVLESLAWPEATREALVDAHVAILRAFVAHAKPIAERLGVTWPHALEDAVRAQWRRELGVEL
jgi:predicted nucleotidyltransferase